MPNIDISVAVATESGLITPIVQNVPSLSLGQISDSVRELAGKAKAGKLQLNEFQVCVCLIVTRFVGALRAPPRSLRLHQKIFISVIGTKSPKRL